MSDSLLEFIAEIQSDLKDILRQLHDPETTRLTIESEFVKMDDKLSRLEQMYLNADIPDDQCVEGLNRIRSIRDKLLNDNSEVAQTPKNTST